MLSFHLVAVDVTYTFVTYVASLYLVATVTSSAMQRPTSLDDNDICLAFPHFLLFGKSR